MHRLPKLLRVHPRTIISYLQIDHLCNLSVLERPDSPLVGTESDRGSCQVAQGFLKSLEVWEAKQSVESVLQCGEATGGEHRLKGIFVCVKQALWVFGRDSHDNVLQCPQVSLDLGVGLDPVTGKDRQQLVAVG